jgi:hypothetical protein
MVDLPVSTRAGISRKRAGIRDAMEAATRAYAAAPAAVAAEDWARVRVACTTAIFASNDNPKAFFYRHQAVYGLASVLASYFPRSDTSLLRAVSRGKHGDNAETMAMASNGIAFLRRDSGDRDGAARQFMRTLKMDREVGRSVFTGGDAPVLSEVLFDSSQDVARSCLAAMQAPPQEDAAEDLTSAEQQALWLKNSSMTRYACAPADMPFAARCTRVRGIVCDECGATPTRLSMCQRCKQRWYCGPKCQRAAWKRHKQVCRDHLQVGDRVLVRGLIKGDCANAGGLEPAFNGLLGTVVGIADEELKPVLPVHTRSWGMFRVEFSPTLSLYLHPSHLRYMMDDPQ